MIHAGMLYWIFFKFGLISFGGGYVLLPLLITELVEKRQVITLETFGNLVSIAQLTPGPIGINAATYIGSTLSSYLFAVLASNIGWQNTILFWGAVCLLGMFACVFAVRRWDRFCNN
jgi:chromate transport protein ChrA